MGRGVEGEIVGFSYLLWSFVIPRVVGMEICVMMMLFDLALNSTILE